MKFLFDWGKKRNILGVIAFYIVSLLVSILLVFVAGYLVGQGKSVADAEKYGLMVGQIIGIVIPLLLVGLFFKAKNLWKDWLAIVVAVLTVLLAIFGGGLILSLIPVAFLTIKNPKK